MTRSMHVWVIASMPLTGRFVRPLMAECSPWRWIAGRPMARSDGKKDFPDDYRLLSTSEAAKVLSVSQSHLCAMRCMPDEGGLRVTYVGSKRTPRYAMRDVIQFIDQGGTPVRNGGFL